MTSDAGIRALGFPRMPRSKTSIPWNLGWYVYPGAAGAGRKKARALIRKGELGVPDKDRLPVLVALHEVVEAELERGVSHHTINANLTRLSRFISWVDARGAALSMQSLRQLYLGWCSHMVHRYKVVKDISHDSAYTNVAGPARIIGLALGFICGEPGRSILKYSTMVAPKRRRKVIGAKAAKQKMEDLYAFGHALLDLCNGLSIDMICGPMPAKITLRGGKTMEVKAGSKYGREPCKRTRLIKVRPSAINLRIEAELLIFIAQTGMNSAQVESLQHSHFRYQTDGDELNVFRAYKGRRGGEVIFRCFREYRHHLERYLSWLEEIGLRGKDKRMFPYLRRPNSFSTLTIASTKRLFAASGVPHVMPRGLRKARVNWLLRRSRDPELTAEQVAHTKETLLRDYEEAHHQSASIELARFHRATDPTLEAGSGKCVRAASEPSMVENAPSNAPEPDCISPEGCLFCVHQRDVESADYCWKLASHAELKKFELAKYRPPKGKKGHPAQATIDRIGAKLDAIAKGSEIRCQWVRDAQDSVRSGIFHPVWDGHIKLAEAL